jgi:Ni/Fe-hydrogenase subunit HybB-like protein
VAGGVMFVYLFLELLKIVHGQLWANFVGPWAAWYLVEVIGLVAAPMVLLLIGAANRQIALIRVGAALTVLGVILNRLNVAIIAYRWYDANHYVPTWQEVVVTLAVICAEIWVFRWVVWRMPVLSAEPDWARQHPSAPSATSISKQFLAH